MKEGRSHNDRSRQRRSLHGRVRYSREEARQLNLTRALPMSSHPEIEEEIRRHEGDLDPSQLRVEPPQPKPRAIISVGGRDVGSHQPETRHTGTRDKAA